MEVLEAISTRRSVAKVSAERPDKSDIEEILEASIRAPNHFLTEPWRFVVLAGEALEGLGEAMAGRVREENADDPELEKRIELEKSRAHRAPVIVAVVYVPATSPRAIEVEDRYSVGALMQNILLGIHSKGMGGYLRTGPSSTYQGVKDYLGLVEGEEIAGFIYAGKLTEESEGPFSERTPASERTRWMGWD